jgi:hypothetical protein
MTCFGQLVPGCALGWANGSAVLDFPDDDDDDDDDDDVVAAAAVVG